MGWRQRSVSGGGAEGDVLARTQGGGDFGLAARHEHDEARAAGEGEAQGVVGGGVAGVQRGDDVDVGRDLRRVERRCGVAGVKAHAVEAEPGGKSLRFFDQFAALLDAVQGAAGGSVGKRAHEQVVENEAEVGLAGAVVDQCEAVALGEAFFEQRRDELVKVFDLLELAPAVLVELAVAGEDVQFFEQLDRLAGSQHLGERIARRLGGAPAHGVSSQREGLGGSARSTETRRARSKPSVAGRKTR